VADLLDGTAQVIRFEERGCGRSDAIPPYTIDNSLLDLESIRQHYNVERWIVAGHSWGATLALIYALHYPEHTRAIICIAGGRLHNDRDWHELYQQRQAQGLEVLPTFDYPTNLEVNLQENQSWKAYIQRPTLLSDLSRLNRPALFLYGERDIRPVWPVEQISQLLPHGRFELIKNADHYLWRTQAASLQASLCAFIQALPP
jgi:proline iminopeptidase